MLHGLGSQLLWGSDYPHLEGTFVFADGLASPSVTRLSLRNTFCEVPAAETERMVGGNAIDVYHVDGAALREIARQIDAPTRDELATPTRRGTRRRGASPRSVPEPVAGADVDRARTRSRSGMRGTTTRREDRHGRRGTRHGSSRRNARVVSPHVDGDGAPHVTPLWFVWDGSALWLTSHRAQRRTVDRPAAQNRTDQRRRRCGRRASCDLRGTSRSAVVAEPVGEVTRTGEPVDELDVPERHRRRRTYAGGQVHRRDRFGTTSDLHPPTTRS